MLILTEKDADALSTDDALVAMSALFLAMADGRARAFPVVREKLGEVRGTFGVKSGLHIDAGVVGLKAGGYWPGNEARGVKNHQSTTLLCNATTGEPIALVAANRLTALRTAAAAALATKSLARDDVETLSLIGAGAQAIPQIEAQSGVRRFRRILVSSRDASRAEKVAASARELHPTAEVRAVDFETASVNADVLVTLTPAAEPVVHPDWIRPGTHINAMGADTAGKGELAPELLGNARVFYDVWEQAVRIGECQKAVALGILTAQSAAGSLGDVLHGRAGRRSPEEITVFDSTGVGLQDISIAAALIAKIKEA